MIGGKDFYGNSLSQRLADTFGKISTQFMSGNLINESPTGKQAHEESVRMEGYEVSAKKMARNCPDSQQSMAKCSEFWIG